MPSTYLTANTGTATNAKKFTLSMWIKRGNLCDTNSQRFYQGYKDGNDRFYVMFDNTNSNPDTLWIYAVSGGTVQVYWTSSRKFRDTHGWYNFVFSADSTLGTAADRLKVYVNGVLETSWTKNNNPGSNIDWGNQLAQSNNDLTISGTESQTQLFDGSMSHIHFIDGTAYDATAFGSFDNDTGEWKINTSPSVTYGNNGYFILKDGNSVTDQSGNSNNFTVGGGTLTKTEDSPSNVFNTLNPLDRAIIGTDPTFANGNTKWTSSGNNTSNNAVQGTIGASSGKYYFEIKATNANYLFVGMRNQNVTPSWDATGYSSNNTGFYGVNNEGKKIVGGTGTSSIFTQISNNDIFCCAYDLDNKKFWVRTNNGAWYASGNPETGANSLGTLADGTYLPIVFNGHYSFASSCECNFGNGYFGTTAVSSAGTNASGNGIFEYDVPTGYTALSTKGLNL